MPAVGGEVPESLRFLFRLMNFRKQSARVSHLEKYEDIVENSRLIQKYYRLKMTGTGQFVMKLIK